MLNACHPDSRTPGTEMGEQVYRRIRWRRIQSDHVSKFPNCCCQLFFMRDVSWGQSSGAISVSLQMITNGGNNEGLFRAGFMQSGSPLPVGNITKGTGQVCDWFTT